MLCAERRRGRGSARGCRAVEPLEELPRGPKPQDLFALHRDSLTGPGIATHAGLTLPLTSSQALSLPRASRGIGRKTPKCLWRGQGDSGAGVAEGICLGQIDQQADDSEAWGEARDDAIGAT